MGIGDMIGKAKDLVSGHEEEADAAIDKAADAADSATGGKATDQIDAGAEKAKDFLKENDA